MSGTRHTVTHGIIWPPRPRIKIPLDSFNGFSRSDLPPETRSSQRSNAESAPGGDKIRLQNLHSRPSYALFRHFRPSYAIFGSALAQPFERKISFSRPTYGVFGGQELPLVTHTRGEKEGHRCSIHRSKRLQHNLRSSCAVSRKASA